MDLAEYARKNSVAPGIKILEMNIEETPEIRSDLWKFCVFFYLLVHCKVLIW